LHLIEKNLFSLTFQRQTTEHVGFNSLSEIHCGYLKLIY